MLLIGYTPALALAGNGSRVAADVAELASELWGLLTEVQVVMKKISGHRNPADLLTMRLLDMEREHGVFGMRLDGGDHSRGQRSGRCGRARSSALTFATSGS